MVIDRWRTAVQVICALLLNPFFFRYMGVCVPVMNCWACPAAAFSCPIGAAGNLLAFGIVPFAVLGVFLVCGLVAGRILCGWVCPFGLLQDALHRIPSRKFAIPARLRPWIFLLPLAFLAGTVVAVPLLLGTESDLFFCRFCPAGTLEAAIPLHFSTKSGGFVDLVIPVLVSWKVWILVAFLVLFVVIKRPFCRLMCPIGVSLGFLNRISIFRVSHGTSYWARLFGSNGVTMEKCPVVDCGRCTDSCPVELTALTQVNTRDCITCFVCTEACPPRSSRNGAAGPAAALQPGPEERSAERAGELRLGGDR